MAVIIPPLPGTPNDYIVGQKITPAFLDWLNKVKAAVEVITAGGAPVNASYLVLGLDPTLTNERVLTAGTNMAFTDTGPNGTLTIDATGGGGLTRGEAIDLPGLPVLL